MALESWALPQLSRLLPLDEDSLKQIISFTDSLPKDAAADHLKELLGDSPQALEFITSFNSRRKAPPAAAKAAPQTRDEDAEGTSAVPKPKTRGKKKGSQFNKLPPARRVEDSGPPSGAYIKNKEEDYMPASSKQRRGAAVSDAFALKETPDALQVPAATSKTASTNPTPKSSASPSPKLPPSAAGPLISDIKSASNSKPSSRTSSPAPKAKVHLTGGQSMHGASTTLADLDSAIRTLELQTNPSLTPSRSETAKRRCNCMAPRHPLLAAAPNCLNCGKIICVKEGLGPCTFCEKPLLSASEIQSMVRVLKDERGRERMEANNAAHKKADATKMPLRQVANLARPGSVTPSTSTPASSDSESEKLAAAKQHRDKLLSFQAQNARRTRIHDEAADFETPDAGTSMWASPAERALQLKRQQKILREQEWNARPEWEKRKVVASLDVSGKKGKVMRKVVQAERPQTPEDSDVEGDGAEARTPEDDRSGGGAFSRNPLMGGLVRPVARVEKGKGAEREKRSTWRRVQDDNDDNEQWILDGGLYGANEGGREFTAEEPPCG